MKYGSLVLGLRSVGGTFALAVAGVLFAGNVWAAHVHCVCGDGKCEVGGHSHSANANWAPWTATNSLPNTAGSWYLTADVNLTEDYNAPVDVNLCLNGHVVTQTTPGKRVITICATAPLNKTFRLTDCRGTGKVTGGNLSGADYGAGVFLYSNNPDEVAASFEFYGGSICGNRAEKLETANAACGGGVYVGKKCQFAMYGGSITNNLVNGNQSDSGTGGGVFGFGLSQLKIYGGDICGNTASRWGGGIESLGALTVGPKARIYGNVAGGAAGICCDTGSSAVFEGGEIFNNTATDGIVSGGVGGVGIYTTGCTFSGKVVIADNLGNGAADDLYLDGKTIALNGLSAGSRIGVRLANPPTAEGVLVSFTSNGAAADCAYFFSNHDGCPVSLDNNSLVIQKATMVRVTPTAVANTTVSVLDNNVPVAPNADGICRVANGADMVKVVYTAAPGYEFAGSQTKHEIALSMEETEFDPVVPATPTAPTLVKSLVVPAAVANATAKIYQGETELSADLCLVALNADVKVVYTAADGYVFADGTTVKAIAVDASVNPATIAATEAPAFVIDSQEKLTAALDYVNYTAAADEDIRWYISTDFTMTAAVKVAKKVASLTILGNGRTLTAEQNGSLITAAFDFVSSDLEDVPVVIKNLNLTVKDGFRHGFNLWRSNIDAHCVQLTLDNVNVTLAHTTQPMKGSTPKSCAAIIASYSALTLSGACTITADEYSWAAIDLTATNGLPAAITIASDDITFVDNRAKETKYVEPLVKTTEESAGAMTATDMARARLYPITLANGTGYLVATMLGGQDALAAAAEALKSVPTIWCITNDFTVSQGIEIANMYGVDLTVLGNGHTLTATQNGTLVGQMFNIKAINNRATLVSFEDLNLVVSDGFRHGVNILREEGYPGIVSAKVTFDNVDITMAHTKEIIKGSDVKTAAAIINNYNDVILTNGCTITANTNCWAAIDVTSKSGFDASLTIASDDITFVDNRTVAMAAIKPLVKKNGDGVTVTGIERTPLKAVTLQDGPGYSYTVSFTAPTVANATAAVFAGEKEIPATGSSYQLPSNGTATVVYTAKSGFIFADGTTAKTNTVDTSKSSAEVQGDLPAVPAYLIVDQATLTKAIQAISNGPDDNTVTWYVASDFTVTKKSVIGKKGLKLTILGNGYKITATQDGALADYVFDILAQRSNPTAVTVEDLNLVVSNGFRNGIQAQWDAAKDGGKPMDLTLENVNVTMARTMAPMKGGEVKLGAALINNDSEVTLKGACAFTADEWTYSAIDITATDACTKDWNAIMTVDSAATVTFVDVRSNAVIAVEPLVKLSDENPGERTAVANGMDRTELVPVTLANGSGWGFASAYHHHDGNVFGMAIGDYVALTNLLTQGGNGYLTADIGITKALEVPEDVKLCLNGHVIYPDVADNKRCQGFEVLESATFEVYDCGTTTNYFEAFSISEGGLSFTCWKPTTEETENFVVGGAIVGFRSGESGPAVFVDNGSTFRLCGGTICGNVGYVASAIYVYGTFEMTGGAISHNDAFYSGAVVIDGGVGVIGGGVLADNAAYGYGGAILGAGKATLTLTGDAIVSGNSAMCGGAICFGKTYADDTGVLNISGNARITDNGGSFGGAVAVIGRIAVTIEGTPRISGNEGANMCLIAHMSGTPVYPSLCITGAVAGAEIGLRTGLYDEDAGFTQTPVYGTPCRISTNGLATAETAAVLVLDRASDYIKITGGDLYLHNRIIDNPALENDMTYMVDGTFYEGSVAYQWYETSYAAESVTGDSSRVLDGYQLFLSKAEYHAASNAWVVANVSNALFVANYGGDFAQIVGVQSLKAGDTLAFSTRVPYDYLSIVEDDYPHAIEPTDRGDGWYDYFYQATHDGDYHIFIGRIGLSSEMLEQAVLGGTSLAICDVRVLTEEVDYDHPLAGQNTKSLDVSGYTDDFSAACVASFKTGETTDFTLVSRLVHGHVHESMLFDREIASEADLVELLENGGNGCLTADVTLTDEVEIGEGVSVNLCLNGHSIIQSKNDSSTLVLEKGILSLYDCQDHPGCITHTEGCNGPGVYVEGSTFNMYGGVISGNCVPASWKLGGGICNAAGGIVHMYGGMITNNVAPFGGGWAGIVGSTNYFHGGAVCGNEATQAGGGGILNEGVFYMYGGDVYGNIATNGVGLAGMGGGICNLRYFLATGGVIRANVASAGGGLANCHGEGDTEAVLSDVTISDNRSNLGGGGVFAIEALMAFTNCTITSNRGENLGMGGVYGFEVDMTIVDSTITGNAGGTSLQAGVVLAGKLHLGGRVVVSGNVSDGAGPGGNIVIAAEQGMLDVLAAKPLTADSSIGVMILESDFGIVVTGGVFLAECDANYASRFFSDSPNYRVVANPDNSLELVERTIVVVTYDAQGGEWAGGSNSVEVVCEDETPMYAFPAYPARDGYDFLGWFDGVTNNAAQATNGAAMLMVASHTLYAKWQSKTVDPAKAEETFVFEDEDSSAADTVITGAVKSVTNGGGDFVIPDRVSNGTAGKFVVEIGRLAFAASRYKQDAIESVTTPLYLTNVNAGAFYQVKTLKKLTLTASVDYANPSKAAKLVIGPRAFAGTALDTIVIPTNVTAIGDYAFMNCSKLKTIVFAGDTAFTMGAKAFDSCGYEADGSIRVFLSTALTNAMPTLVESIRASNPSLKIVPMVGVSPLSGLDISSLTPTDGKIYLRVNVDTVIPGAKPLASTVQVQFTADLGDPHWQPVKSVNTALDGGMVLVEFASPTNPGYLRVCVSE